LRGRVLDPNGIEVAGVIVYAYHTHSAGIYPPDAGLADTSAAPHGKLRGWARSGERGEYAFDIICPPLLRPIDPQHIHTHVLSGSL
jgi:protocatechuate 3,4-dioxygenase beta subunit